MTFWMYLNINLVVICNNDKLISYFLYADPLLDIRAPAIMAKIIDTLSVI